MFFGVTWVTFMYLCRHVNVIRRPVNVCHGFVLSCFRYFCHSNVFHAHACHAIMCHAIVTSCKCLSCKRGHVNERPTSASSCVPSWLRSTVSCLTNMTKLLSGIDCTIYKVLSSEGQTVILCENWTTSQLSHQHQCTMIPLSTRMLR